MRWFVEEGIGEDRAIGVEGERIVAARLEPHGRWRLGAQVPAQIVHRQAGGRAVATAEGGATIQLPRVPRAVTEGARITVRITREALFEATRSKPMVGQVVESEPCPAPSLLESLKSGGAGAEKVHRFPVSGWDELMGDAFAAQGEFAGGTLHLTPAAAMTLIDVDGTLPPRELALAAIPAVGEALRRFDIGGSIGIDFPTLPAKADRREADEAIERALDGWPHERTAMNGFGFVQIVARSERPSLLHRAQFRPRDTALRWLMRRAENVAEPGTLLLVTPYDTDDPTCGGWAETLAERTGRQVRWQRDPSLRPEGSYVQAVP